MNSQRLTTLRTLTIKRMYRMNSLRKEHSKSSTLRMHLWIQRWELLPRRKLGTHSNWDSRQIRHWSLSQGWQSIRTPYLSSSTPSIRDLRQALACSRKASIWAIWMWRLPRMTKISYRMRPNPCLRSKTALQPSIRQLARTSSQMWYLSSTQSRVSVRYWREYLSSNSTKKTRVSLTFHIVY